MIRGDGGNDLIDGNSDFDDVDGGEGRDVCLNGEVLAGCELP